MAKDRIEGKIDAEKIEKFGFEFGKNLDAQDLYLYMKSLIDWLECHNMNYNKNQYNKIQILKDLFECIDIEQG